MGYHYNLLVFRQTESFDVIDLLNQWLNRFEVYLNKQLDTNTLNDDEDGVGIVTVYYDKDKGWVYCEFPIMGKFYVMDEIGLGAYLSEKGKIEVFDYTVETTSNYFSLKKYHQGLLVEEFSILDGELQENVGEGENNKAIEIGEINGDNIYETYQRAMYSLIDRYGFSDEPAYNSGHQLRKEEYVLIGDVGKLPQYESSVIQPQKVWSFSYTNHENTDDIAAAMRRLTEKKHINGED